MGVRNLDKIFKPRRIAVVCVRERASGMGLNVLKNLLAGGYEGVVYPISNERESIHGIPTYPSIKTLPKLPDLALLCSPPECAPGLVRECGEAGVRGLVILSGGFRENGELGKELQRQIAEITAEYQDMRVLGPNSLGVIAPHLGLNASDAVTPARPGHLAFISQSRSLCNSILDWASDEGIGFSYFVSTGNKLDVDFGDLIDYFATDPLTRAIIIYLQSIEHARSFMSAARAFSRTKPIVVYKGGQFNGSAKAALFHTGEMAGEDAVYEAAFQRAGIVRVRELDDIFDVAEVLASQRLPKGPRLAILGNAGGPGVIAADALLSKGGILAQLGEESLQKLDALLPPVWSRGNPVDLLDGAPPERYAEAIRIVLQDGAVDAVLVIFAAQTVTDAAAVAWVVVEEMRRSHKPMLAAWLGGSRVRPGIRVLNEAGIPTHTTPEQAVRGFMHLVSYARNLEALYETPRDIHVRFAASSAAIRSSLEPLLRDNKASPEILAKRFLEAYEIPQCPCCVAHTLEEAVCFAENMGYPVVLKVLSPQIPHKTEVGGVVLDLQAADEVRAAYRSILKTVAQRAGSAVVAGVTVQKMLTHRYGLELVLGAKQDPTFGPVIMTGMGGVATGVFQDVALGLPPLNERLARRMLESLRFWPLLQGYRGQPGVDLDRLVELMMRFAQLVADFPEIEEFDINPLLVTPEEVVVVDAKLKLDRRPADLNQAYARLAIRPFPQEYVRKARLKNGTPVTLRPIRPEDEPLWYQLIASSSPETIRFRFRSLFRRATHQMAIEHCVIDYEREIAIVATIDHSGAEELVGVGQLSSDADHLAAEYGVLVPDPWQGQGIGGMLLDYCLELAEHWGIRRVVAETDPENSRMLAVFRKRGFHAEIHRDEEVVLLEKQLEPMSNTRSGDVPAVVEGISALL